MKVAIVKVTEENRDFLRDLALSQFLGMPCRYCGKTFETVEDLHDAVGASQPGERFQIAHAACWKQRDEDQLRALGIQP